MLYELIVRFDYKKCKEGYIWCIDGSFIHPSEFKSSGKTAFGYALDDCTVASLRRSELMRTWTNAKLYCEECSNAGRHGYLPDLDELTSLYKSIMSGGKMRTDLRIAGIYEMCNYRYSTISSWSWVWSSSVNEFGYASHLNYNGSMYNSNKKYSDNHAIPFFKFRCYDCV